MSALSEQRNTTFRADVLRLVSGTGIAQAIGILATPIIARLYGPEAYGLLAVFTALTGILGVLACMRYELSIVIPDDDREGANLFGVSLGFSALLALLTTGIVWLGGAQILRWLNLPELAPYLWLLPLAVMIHGASMALSYWNTRTKHFMRLSIAQVIGKLTGTSGILIAGFAGHATGGAMIATSVAGRAVSTFVLGGQIWRDNGKFFARNIRWREMLAGVKRHRKFPIYGSWAGLLNAASWQLPALMLGAFFSPVIVGFYALGFRILHMPMSLVGTAISKIFIQRAAEARRAGTLSSLVEQLFRKLVIVSLLPMLILAIIGEDLYALVFGERWQEAGVYTQILSVWAFVWFVSSPLSSLFGVLDRQEQGLYIQGWIFGTRLLSLAIGGYLGDARLALLLFSLTGIFVYGYLVFKIFECSGLPASTIGATTSRSALIAIPYLLPILTAKILGVAPYYLLTLSVSIGAIYLYMHRADLTSSHALR